MKLCLGATLVACLAATSTASAATMTVEPKRSCHSSGETVKFTGTGFTPNGKVSFARDGTTFEPLLNSNPTGDFIGALKLALRSGNANRTYTATDVADPTVVATRRMLVAAPSVTIRPADLDVGLRARDRREGLRHGAGAVCAHHPHRGFRREAADEAEGAQPEDRAAQGSLRKAARPEAPVLEARAPGRLPGAVRHLQALDARRSRSSSCTPRRSRSSSAGRARAHVGVALAQMLRQRLAHGARSSAPASRYRPSSSRCPSSGSPAISQRTASRSKRYSTRRCQRSSLLAAAPRRGPRARAACLGQLVAQRQRAIVADPRSRSSSPALARARRRVAPAAAGSAAHRRG